MDPLKLTHFALYLNHLADRDYYRFSVDEVKEQIQGAGFELFDCLEQNTLDDSINISLLNDEDRLWILDEFRRMVEDEKHTPPIQNKGICLLLAYVFELIKQQRG